MKLWVHLWRQVKGVAWLETKIYNFFDQNLFLKTVFAQASGATFHVSKTDKYNPILMIREEVDSIFTNGFHKRP